jgi:hypothetical protein
MIYAIRGNLEEKREEEINLRDLSWRLRCSLRLNALLQNWHLYFFSGASDDLRAVGVDVAEDIMAATGIVATRAVLQDRWLNIVLDRERWRVL